MSELKQASISDVQVICPIDLIHISLLSLYATNWMSLMFRTGCPDHCCCPVEKVADEHIRSRLMHNPEAEVLEQINYHQARVDGCV